MNYETVVLLAGGDAPDYHDRNRDTRTWEIEPLNPRHQDGRFAVLVRQRVTFVAYRFKKVYDDRPGVQYKYEGVLWTFPSRTSLDDAFKFVRENL